MPAFIGYTLHALTSYLNRTPEPKPMTTAQVHAEMRFFSHSKPTLTTHRHSHRLPSINGKHSKHAVSLSDPYINRTTKDLDIRRQPLGARGRSP